MHKLVHVGTLTSSTGVFVCAFVLYVCAQRLERCHRDLGAQTTNIRENEVYNHLSEKVWHMTRGSEMTRVCHVYTYMYIQY